MVLILTAARRPQRRAQHGAVYGPLLTTRSESFISRLTRTLIATARVTTLIAACGALGVCHATLLTRQYYHALYGFSHVLGGTYGLLLGIVACAIVRNGLLRLTFLTGLAACLLGSLGLSRIRDMWTPSFLGIVNAALWLFVWLAMSNRLRLRRDDSHRIGCEHDLTHTADNACPKCGTQQDADARHSVYRRALAFVGAVLMFNGLLLVVFRIRT